MSEQFLEPNVKSKFYVLQPGECVCKLGEIAMNDDDSIADAAKRTLARDKSLWTSSLEGIRLNCLYHVPKLYGHDILTFNVKNLR